MRLRAYVFSEAIWRQDLGEGKFRYFAPANDTEDELFFTSNNRNTPLPEIGERIEAYPYRNKDKRAVFEVQAIDIPFERNYQATGWIRIRHLSEESE